MVLGVFTGMMSVGTTSRLLDEIVGTVEILLVSRHLIELAQSHLNDGMAARTVNLPFVRTKGLTDQIGILDCHVQERAFARCAVVSDCRLNQMAAVVQFVGVDLFPFRPSPPSAQPVALVRHTSGQIAVILLCRGNDCNDAVQIVVQLLVVMDCQRIAGTLNHLVRIGVIKRKVTTMLTFLQASGNGKIVETSALLTFPESRGNADGTIDLYTRKPEIITQMYIREGHFNYCLC